MEHNRDFWENLYADLKHYKKIMQMSDLTKEGWTKYDEEILQEVKNQWYQFK